jgi:hypothetical protein
MKMMSENAAASIAKKSCDDRIEPPWFGQTNAWLICIIVYASLEIGQG